METSRFQKTVGFLLDNLFDILTILFAASLIIRHQVQPFTHEDFVEFATWILAVLGLIAVSGLWDRNRRLQRIEKLSEESRDLVLRYLGGKVRAIDFFSAGEKVSDKFFSSGATILLAGITQTRTTRQYMHVLGQRLIAGSHIQIIIIEPEINSVMEVMAARSMGDTTPEYWRTRMETVYTVIKDIANTPGSKGSMEVGYLPYIPSFGLVIIDPDQPHGVCVVELYQHRTAEPNPTFELQSLDDPFWFNFFYNQYKIMWKDCRIENVSVNSKKP